MPVTQDHVETELLHVDVLITGHDPRTTTPLFEHTRKAAIALLGDECFCCGRKSNEDGNGPNQWHHALVERCEEDAVDIERFRRAIEHLGALYDRSRAWLAAHPVDFDINDFVDDMTANGLCLCQTHHTGVDHATHDGIGTHYLPGPLWNFWAFGRIGFEFVKGHPVIDVRVQPLTAPLPAVESIPVAVQSIASKSSDASADIAAKVKAA